MNGKKPEGFPTRRTIWSDPGLTEAGYYQRSCGGLKETDLVQKVRGFSGHPHCGLPAQVI